MGDRVTYIGLDVHKDGIVVAVAEGRLRGAVRDYGLIANTPAALLVIACLGSIIVEIRLAVGRKLIAIDGLGFRLLQHLFVWTLLPAAVLHAAMIWGGVITSPVLWAHVRYIVDKTGRVLAVDRRPYSDQSI